MRRKIEKKAKVALCRVCKGTGLLKDHQKRTCQCAQCEGSGRVWVSLKGELTIEPYRNN